MILLDIAVDGQMTFLHINRKFRRLKLPCVCQITAPLCKACLNNNVACRLLLARTDFRNRYAQFKTVFFGKSVWSYVVLTNVAGHDTDCDVTSGGEYTKTFKSRPTRARRHNILHAWTLLHNRPVSLDVYRRADVTLHKYQLATTGFPIRIFLHELMMARALSATATFCQLLHERYSKGHSVAS